MKKINIKDWPKSIWVAIALLIILKLLFLKGTVLSSDGSFTDIIIWGHSLISLPVKYNHSISLIFYILHSVLPVLLTFYFILYFVFKHIQLAMLVDKVKFWRFTFSHWLLFYYVYFLSIYYIHFSHCLFTCSENRSTPEMFILSPIWYVFFCLLMKLVILLAKKIGLQKVKILIIILTTLFALPSVLGTVLIYPSEESAHDLSANYFYLYLPGSNIHQGSKYGDGVCLGFHFKKGVSDDGKITTIGCVGYVLRK